IGRVEYGAFSGIELFDVVVGPPPGFARDVLRARRVAVRYAIEPLRAAIELKEAAIDDPHVVVERKGLRSNLDAIQEHLSEGKEKKDEPEQPKAPMRPLRGPLSPVTLQLDTLAIRSLSLEVVGDGPNLSVEGAHLEASASLDRRSAGAKLVIGLV